MTDTDLQITLEERTKQLIQFRSTEDRPAELLKCAEWIRNEIEAAVHDNAQVEVRMNNTVPSVLAVHGKWKEPDMLLIGHFDIVDGSDEQFEPYVEGDKLYGRGAADMKAGVAALMSAFEHAVQKHPEKSVGLMLTGDEECGGADGVGIWAQDGWLPKMIINLDGGYGEQISHAEKGILRLLFKATGEKAQVHYPWRGNCAFDSIVQVYHVLADLFPNKSKATDEDNWYTTYTVKEVSTSPNENAVVSEAQMHVSVHFVEDETPDEILERIQNALPEGVEVECTLKASRVFVDPNDKVLQRFQECYAEFLGYKPEIVGENGTSDARYFADRNIPIIITKPESGNPEQEGEWVSLSSLVKLTRALNRFISGC